MEQKQYGKIMNRNKTQVMLPEKGDIKTDNTLVQKIAEYVYLGQILSLSRENQGVGISRRVKLS